MFHNILVAFFVLIRFAWISGLFQGSYLGESCCSALDIKGRFMRTLFLNFQ